jgi:hypothetical protein
MFILYMVFAMPRKSVRFVGVSGSLVLYVTTIALLYLIFSSPLSNLSPKFHYIIYHCQESTSIIIRDRDPMA